MLLPKKKVIVNGALNRESFDPSSKYLDRCMLTVVPSIFHNPVKDYILKSLP
jgi:hypothetical protein